MDEQTSENIHKWMQLSVKYVVDNGWVPFGFHVSYIEQGFDVPLEFSPDTDEAGMPIYERLRGFES